MSADFLDSNVFVYLFDETDARKRAISEQLIERSLSLGTGCISFQVVQETLNVIGNKLARPSDSADVRRFMETVLSPLWRIMPSRPLYHRALDLKSRYGYSFYDSLIVAAALDAGCRKLYSEDLQHGQRIEQLEIENPFREARR